MKRNTRRRDKNRVILKTGESYREKEDRYVYRWTDRRGKRHAIYAQTLDDLRDKEAQISKDRYDGIKAEARYFTLNDVYAIWKKVKRGLRDHTFQNYTYMYDTFVYPSLGKSRIKLIKKTDVRKFYNYLFDEMTLSLATIDNIHTVVHQVFDLAVEDDYIRNNPSDKALKELRLSQGFRTEKKRALTREEEELLLEFLKKSKIYKRWYPIIAVMLGTGMRVGEVTGLRWCDVDFDKGVIDVNHNLIYYAHRIVNEGEKQGSYFSINEPKTRAGCRKIPMFDSVKEALIMEKKYQDITGNHCKAIIDGYTDFIFVNRYGGILHQGLINKAIRHITRDCNLQVIDKSKDGEHKVILPHFSCHSLRHTFATRLCEEEWDYKVIEEVMGHSDIRTTMDIYTDVSDEHLMNYFRLHNRKGQTEIDLTPFDTKSDTKE